MVEKLVFHRREFLNSRHGLAAIEASVKAGDDDTYIEAAIALTDCNRRVDLDFTIYLGDLDTDYSLNSRMEKVDKLYDAIASFRRNYKSHAKKMAKQFAKKPPAQSEPSEPEANNVA